MSAQAIIEDRPYYPTETLHHWIQDGVRHHQEGRFDQAQMVYEAILAADPDQPMILSLLGLARHQQGDSAGGETLIRRAIGLDSNSGYLHDHLALTLDAQGDQEGAMEEHAQSVILDPGHAPGWYNLGMMMMRRDRDEDALRCVMRALDLDSRNPVYRTGFGRTLAKLDHPAEAADAYRLALLSDPTFAEAYTALSELWTKTGHTEAAQSAADAAQKLRDGTPDPLGNFAHAMHDRIAATFPSAVKH